MAELENAVEQSIDARLSEAPFSTHYSSIKETIRERASAEGNLKSPSLIQLHIANRRAVRALEEASYLKKSDTVAAAFVGGIGLLLFLVIFAIQVWFFPESLDPAEDRHFGPEDLTIGRWVGLVGIAMTGLILLAISRFDHRRRDLIKHLSEIRVAVPTIGVDYKAALAEEVEKALNTGLSQAMAQAIDVPIVIGSAKLVETHNSEIVETRAFQEVLAFIESHETSAVGVAGERGIGKSTLLHYVAERTRAAGGLAVEVSVPVIYEPEELIGRVFEELIREAQFQPAILRQTLETPRKGLVRRGIVGVSGTITAALGAAMLLGIRLPNSWSTPVVGALTEVTRDPYRLTGVALAVVGLAMTGLAILWPIRSRRPAPSITGQQRGAVFEAHRGARRSGAVRALRCRCGWVQTCCVRRGRPRCPLWCS